jgi:hypothetical protein
MAGPEGLLDTVRTIIQLTREGKLEWEQLSGNARGFYLGLPSGSVLIEADANEVGVQLKVLNDRGTVLETYSPEYGTADWQTLSQTWGLARRRALRVDETIDGVLADLRKLG